jgi:hypothetical protein
MEYKLTTHRQYSKKCADGRTRNFLIYFLNGVEIFKHKIPFDTNYDAGHDRHTAIYNDYLYNGRIYQTRTSDVFCGGSTTGKTRLVSFPVSRKKLLELGVPNNMKIVEGV